MGNFNNIGLNAGLNARCGWICRQLSKLSNFVEGLPFIGSMTNNFINEIQKAVDIFDGQDGWKTEVFEPTPAEEIILDVFVNKLNIFVKNMLVSLDAAIANNQIVIVNKELAKMCIVIEYFSANEKAGLSKNAVNIRHSLIQQIFEPIKTELKLQFGNTSGMPALLTANQNDFNGLFENTVAGQQYYCSQYPSNTSINPVNSGDIKIRSISSELFNPVLENPAVPVTPTENVTENPTGLNADKAFMWISRGLLLVTAIGVASQFLKKKKK